MGTRTFSSPVPARRAALARALVFGLALPAGALRSAHGQSVVDPLRRLDAAQRAAVQAFLKRRTQPGVGVASAERVEVADLGGDGRGDLLPLWTLLGATGGTCHLTPFTASAGRWRDASTADLAGMVRRPRVQGRGVVADTLVSGPNGPRCCPSRKARRRVRRQGGRLVASRP
jgi:hypothetical protein